MILYADSIYISIVSLGAAASSSRHSSELLLSTTHNNTLKHTLSTTTASSRTIKPKENLRTTRNPQYF